MSVFPLNSTSSATIWPPLELVQVRVFPWEVRGAALGAEVDGEGESEAAWLEGTAAEDPSGRVKVTLPAGAHSQT